MLIAQGWVKLGGWMTGMWLPIVAGGATVLRELEDRPARLGRWKDKRHDVERQYQLDQERLIAKHEDMDRRRRCAAAAAGATCFLLAARRSVPQHLPSLPNATPRRDRCC